MNQELWNEVDRYCAEKLLGQDPALEAALAANAAAGLPAIDVSPTQGKLLYLLAKVHGARRILEIGTLGGYSTISLARALPVGGRLIALELEPAYARAARQNLENAGVSERVEIRVGPALQSLEALRAEKAEPFDLVFIDADKANTPHYYREARALCRPGSVIITDNVIRGGKLVDAASEDPNIRGMRTFMDILAADEGVEATSLPTVGLKGYDGLVLIRVKG